MDYICKKNKEMNSFLFIIISFQEVAWGIFHFDFSIYLNSCMFTFVIRKEIINSKILKINLTSSKGYILEGREVISDSNGGIAQGGQLSALRPPRGVGWGDGRETQKGGDMGIYVYV